MTSNARSLANGTVVGTGPAKDPAYDAGRRSVPVASFCPSPTSTSSTRRRTASVCWRPSAAVRASRDHREELRSIFLRWSVPFVWPFTFRCHTTLRLVPVLGTGDVDSPAVESNGVDGPPGADSPVDGLAELVPIAGRRPHEGTDELAEWFGLSEREVYGVRSAKAGNDEDGYSEALLGVDEAGWFPLRVRASEYEVEVIGGSGKDVRAAD